MGKPEEIYRAPRCRAQLAAYRIYEPYAKFDDYLLAEVISQRWADKTLASTGMIDFWTMTGPELIRAFEKILTFGLAGRMAGDMARRYGRE